MRIIWLPNLNGIPGSHFFVKYKLKGETIPSESDPEFQSNTIEIRGLQSGEVYVMSVVAVDGEYMTESAPQEVETSSEGPIIQPKENVATAGWFIGITVVFINKKRLYFVVRFVTIRYISTNALIPSHRNDVGDRHSPLDTDCCLRHQAE